jgi:hypothetical protein
VSHTGAGDAAVGGAAVTWRLRLAIHQLVTVLRWTLSMQPALYAQGPTLRQIGAELDVPCSAFVSLLSSVGNLDIPHNVELPVYAKRGLELTAAYCVLADVAWPEAARRCRFLPRFRSCRFHGPW